jgi:hypothetical protein
MPSAIPTPLDEVNFSVKVLDTTLVPPRLADEFGVDAFDTSLEFP